MKKQAVVIGLALSLLLAGCAVLGGENESEGNEAVAAALPGAKISLEAGIAAASAAGNPISAKFEVEDGKLQLSVYVSKDAAFSEIVVDHQTGKVGEAEPITEGEDLGAAKAQAKAMTGAKVGLGSAVNRALSANKGFLAVSAYPVVEAGHAVAKITLVKGEHWKTLTEKLD